MPHWTDKLIIKNACPDAVKWAKQFPMPQDAWKVCERGDWMIWFCRHFRYEANNKRAFVQTALAIAESVKDKCSHIPEAAAARQTAQEWLDNPNKKTREKAARAATEAARAAAEAAEAAWAAWAAWAARAATEAARAAAEATGAAGATWAAWAARAAWAAIEAGWGAAEAAGAAEATWAAQNEINADICRKFLTCPEL